MNAILTIERFAALNVSVRAYKEQYGPKDRDFIEVCAGTTVGVTSIHNDRESLCELPGGREVWIEEGYL